MRKMPVRKASVRQPRWALYAAAGAATALGGVHFAEGEIFYSGRVGLKFEPSRNRIASAHIQLDQPGDSINPLVAETNSEAVFGRAQFGVLGVGGASVVGTLETFHGLELFSWLSRLNPGVNLSTQAFVPHTQFRYDLVDYGSGDSHTKWRDRGVGYVGFRFNDGNGWRYGWARLRKGKEPGNFLELIDYAYGDVDEPVRTGQKSSHDEVPAEGSLGLLAIGATGLLAWRKNRARKTQAKS